MSDKKTLQYISDKLWENVNEENYYVQNFEQVIYLMKKSNYPLINIPDEFAKLYEGIYYSYARKLISKKPIEFLFLDENIALKNLDSFKSILNDMPEINDEDMEKISKRMHEFEQILQIEKEISLNKN